MAIFKPGTWPIASRMTAGTLHFKNLYSNTFAYTETQKKPVAGTNTAIHAAISGSLSTQTVTTDITDPDVPRALKVVVGGTAGHVADSRVTVTGTNIEGKIITEDFRTTAGATGTLSGVKAFRTVSSIRIEAQLGVGCTFSIGTRDIFGVNHRLYNQNTTVKVYTATTVANPTVLTLDTEPAITADEVDIELNTVTPDSVPDSTKFYVICYAYDNWSDGSTVNDQPEYSTTTSTSSTSSSTSTSTITTSTSSTSVSTSSTSSSTSSTSSSTSSTSTSTTTTP